ncbi:MAG: FAD binding domain-containing protein [Acidimicrobiales bacterium]
MHPVQQHHRHVHGYHAVTSVDAALDLLAEHGEAARLVAGGTDILLELERGVRPGIGHLIDVTRIAGADEITVGDGSLNLGFATTHAQVIASSDVVEHALPLAQACVEVGSPQLRNRATVVGNLVTASPANDTISALIALDAAVSIRSASGTRAVDVADFYTGLRTTVLEPAEMVTGITVPTAPAGLDRRGLYVKLGLRRAQAISIVHLAVVVDLDDDIVTRARVALGSLAPTVFRATGVENLLVGAPLDGATIDAAVDATRAAVNPIADVRATAEYRADALGTVVARALRTLASGRHRERWAPDSPRLWVNAPGGHCPTGEEHATSTDGPAPVTATVNGTELTATADPSSTALDWLRESAHHVGEGSLTGTKEGCAEGECGACTIVMDGMAVMSCLVPAPRVAGTDITTVEGLARLGRSAEGGDNTVEGLAEPDQLHAIQEAFVDKAAVQCGFCIPGFLVSGASLIAEHPRPTPAQIRTGLSGNLCRCTGYYKIIEAVEAAAEASS